MGKINLIELLNHIDPASCDYTEWAAVGMALKEDGYSVSDWERWSSGDPARFHHGECDKKWKTFNGTGITGGTIYQMAIDRGWEPDRGRELSWDDYITVDDEHMVVDASWLEGKAFRAPAKWDPVKEVITYLETLFEAGENVGYVMQSYKNEKGKFVPRNKGNYDRTAGELIEALTKSKDITDVLGSYDENGGAWIRFNPLDGKGVKNENVTDFRYALVESDNMELEKQNAIISELELPIAVLMYSGGKSIHAIVKVEAANYQEYRKRVDYLYKICEKNGLAIDTQNKNPARLSRLPGVIRGEKKQYLISTNTGKASWSEWEEWIEGVNDNLPDIEDLSEVWDNIPELADCLIDGVLRKGHKMLLSGPSKAGKSFLQIELAIALAEGREWLGWQCSQGRVMYVNLELDSVSCLHRFRDVYEALHLKPENLKNIDIWNLRGKAVPMDKLAPKLIRRAQKKQYEAIIIDPIYKVITGDENSAEQMSKFCNQFDRICTELGCAVIYCHHHSKGAQGQKRSEDRASGSGVFARDPDTQLDIIELEVTDDLIKQEINKAICEEILSVLPQCLTSWDWNNDLSQDDRLNHVTLLNICQNKLNKYDYGRINDAAFRAEARIKDRTAWRVEGILREFKGFPPKNVWFDYPIHIVDSAGGLQDLQPETEKSGYQKMIEKRQKQIKEKNKDTLNEIIVAYEGLEEDGRAAAVDVAEEIGVSPDTMKRWFGNSKKCRRDYKKIFKTYIDEDTKKLYLERKESTTGSTD